MKRWTGRAFLVDHVLLEKTSLVVMEKISSVAKTMAKINIRV